MPISMLPLVLGLVAAGGLLVAFLAVATVKPSQADVLERRVRRYEGEQPLSLEELELRAPFVERVVRPAILRTSELLTRRTPEATRAELNRRLNLAGRPLGLTAAEFAVTRYLLAILLTAAAVAVAVLAGATPLTGILLVVLGAGTGFFGPLVFLRFATSSRSARIRRSLPNALDLLVVTVEAGLSFEAAMARVAEKYRNPLSEEFARVLQETRLGRSRWEAMEDMAERCEVDELSSFVQAVLQSEQLGTPIAQILRVQAEEMRRRRLQRAQIKGARASLKMLLPMVLFIFPTIWVILLGPAALYVARVFR